MYVFSVFKIFSVNLFFLSLDCANNFQKVSLTILPIPNFVYLNPFSFAVTRKSSSSYIATNSTSGVTPAAYHPQVAPGDLTADSVDLTFNDKYHAYDVNSGTIKEEVCLRKGIMFRLEIDVPVCFAVKDITSESNSFYYYNYCDSSYDAQEYKYFYINPASTTYAVPTHHLGNDLVYVDRYNSVKRRFYPLFELDAGTYDDEEDAENTRELVNLIKDVQFSTTTGSAEFDFQTLTVTPVSFDDTNSIHVTLQNNNDASSQNGFDIKTLTCPENKYPVVISKYNYSPFYKTRYEYFSLYRDSIEDANIVATNDPRKPAMDGWKDIYAYVRSADTQFLYEYGDCFDAGDYFLQMGNLNNNKVELLASWNSGNFLSVVFLSKEEEGNRLFTGYTVGDFAYSAVKDETTTSSYSSIPLHVGPVNCDDGVLVSVTKYSTTNSYKEGFELHVTKEDASTQTLRYAGFPLIDDYTLLDPIFQTYLCFATTDTVVAELQSYTVINSFSSTTFKRPWSTDRSKRTVLPVFKDRDGTLSINTSYPSHMKFVVYYHDSYSNGVHTAPFAVYGGGNFAVLSSASLHDPSVERPATPKIDETDFAYDFYLLKKFYTVAYTVQNDGSEAPEATIVKNYGDPIDIQVQCTSGCEGIKIFHVRCYLTEADANSATHAVDCGSHGLRISTAASSLAINGTFGLETGPDEFFVRIEPTIQSHYYLLPDASKYKLLHFHVTAKPEEPIFNFCVNHIVAKDTPVRISCYGTNNCLPVCTHYNEQLERDVQYTLDINSNHTVATLTFNFASYQPVVCAMGPYNHNIVLLPSISYTSSTEGPYHQVCVDKREKSTAQYFDSFTNSGITVVQDDYCYPAAEILEEDVDPGHGYLHLEFVVTPQGSHSDANILHKLIAFRDEFSFALGELLPIPVKTTKVVSIEESGGVYVITVVLDTAVDYTKDMNIQMLDFDSAALQEALLKNYPALWANWAVVLDTESIQYEYRSSRCYDTEPATYDFHFNGQDLHFEDIQWKGVNNFYYSYYKSSAIPSTFTGSITRYCKPKYYESVFTDPYLGSLVPVNPTEENLVSYNFKIGIEHQDPRGANMDFRNALARSIYKYILSEADVIAHDVNVYMVEGNEDSSDLNAISDDTIAMVQILLENEASKSALDDTVQQLIRDQDTGLIDELTSKDILDYMNVILRGSFRVGNKRLYIRF